MKWVSGTPGDWVLKINLSPFIDSTALKQVNPININKKGPLTCYFLGFL